jgi:hypothetical protein
MTLHFDRNKDRVEGEFSSISGLTYSSVAVANADCPTKARADAAISLSRSIQQPSVRIVSDTNEDGCGNKCPAFGIHRKGNMPLTMIV